jgi:hypothetical protein
MSTIAENYLGLIPSADWLRLLQLAVEKESYMTNIIEAETGPRRKKRTCEAYARFVRVVIDRTRALANTG